MNRRVIFVLILFSLMVNKYNIFAVKGSGTVISEERDVKKFHTVKLIGIGSVYITKGNKKKIEIESDDNIMSILKTEVDRGVLTISTKKIVTDVTTLNIDIYMEDINELNVNGSGSIVVRAKTETDNINLKVNGSGNIKIYLEAEYVFTKLVGTGTLDISGESTSHEIEVTGPGEVNSFELFSEKTSVKLSGLGICRIRTFEELNAVINVGGEIEYKGQPKVNMKVSGAGTIKAVD